MQIYNVTLRAHSGLTYTVVDYYWTQYTCHVDRSQTYIQRRHKSVRGNQSYRCTKVYLSLCYTLRHFYTVMLQENQSMIV